MTDWDWDTQLALAIIDRDLNKISEALDNGADIDLRVDSHKNTPLLVATSHVATSHDYDKPEIVKLLIDRGANLDLKTYEGFTALNYAAYLGCDSIVSLLINKGANLDLQNNMGRTALISAVSNNHSQIVKDLLQGGADPDVRDEEGCTALIWAGRYSRVEAAEALIDKGAKLFIKDNKDRTAWDWVQRNKSPEMISIFEKAMTRKESEPAAPETPKPKTVLERIEEQRRNSTFAPPWSLGGEIV